MVNNESLLRMLAIKWEVLNAPHFLFFNFEDIVRHVVTDMTKHSSCRQAWQFKKPATTKSRRLKPCAGHEGWIVRRTKGQKTLHGSVVMRMGSLKNRDIVWKKNGSQEKKEKTRFYCWIFESKRVKNCRDNGTFIPREHRKNEVNWGITSINSIQTHRDYSYILQLQIKNKDWRSWHSSLSYWCWKEWNLLKLYGQCTVFCAHISWLSDARWKRPMINK